MLQFVDDSSGAFSTRIAGLPLPQDVTTKYRTDCLKIYTLCMCILLVV